MDNNDSNIKSQQTGGLKLMTVFIAVLALHVVVIGGFTVYHLMSGGGTDADLATTDKSHKDMKTADGATITETTLPDGGLSDKSATTPPATTTPTEVATIPQAAPAPAITPAAQPDATAPAMATASTSAPTPAPALAPAPALKPALAPAPTLTPAPALTLTAPTAAPLAPPAEMMSPTSQTPSGPISSTLAPPLDNAPSLTAPLAAGPVHMPTMTASSATPKPEREHQHQQMYTVKITDSYKKIALAHHVTVAELKEANHIKGNVLHTGQKLVIPSEGKMVAQNATVTPTTLTLDSTPTISEAPAPMTTGLSSSTSSSSTAASTGLHHHTYTVVKGDTLTKIAHKFKTTTSAIMAENGITNPTKLSIGKKLKIPSEESRSARNTPPASTEPSQVQAKSTQADGQLANFTP